MKYRILQELKTEQEIFIYLRTQMLHGWTFYRSLMEIEVDFGKGFVPLLDSYNPFYDIIPGEPVTKKLSKTLKINQTT